MGNKENNASGDAGAEDERPPFGTWRGWYAAVLLALAALIAALTLVSRAYR
mgnify:CR=1 FL=1